MSSPLPELVIPFRGDRYRDTARLGRLIAPPYDVIAANERARYAAEAHNIVHVMLPEAPSGGDRYAWAAAELARWRAEGVLARDARPSVYVVAQEFSLPSGERRTRRGFFGAVAAESYDTRRVRPHERTHAGPKADRLALLQATKTNLESIFLIAPDADGTLDAALAAATRAAPDATAELDGVRIALWVVSGNALSRIPIPQAPLYIADGHHRYETAATHAADGGDGRVLGLIVSARDPGLAVLPTHRVLLAPGRDVGKLTQEWRRWFDVEPAGTMGDRAARLAERGKDHTAFWLALSGGDELVLTLRRDASLDQVPELGRTPSVRSLDVSIAEALVIGPIVRAGSATVTLGYTPDAENAVERVRQRKATAAVLLNPTRVEQVIAVADAGDVMPPKSTYFIPKVPSGVVVRAEGAA